MAPASSRSPAPTLRIERALLRAGADVVCGMDEVGRGALSGPVTVGAVSVDARCRSLPGVRDSKLLAPSAREELVPAIRGWAVAWAVGHASAAEIDADGIIRHRHVGEITEDVWRNDLWLRWQAMTGSSSPTGVDK